MPTTTPSARIQAAISKKAARKAWVLILVCIPFILLAVYYTPLLVSLGWHVMHGMAVNYRGLRVRVPLGWTADLALMKDDFPANPQGITIEKQPETLRFESGGPEMMYFNLLLPDPRSGPAQQAEQWKALFRQAHPSPDFEISHLDGTAGGMDCLEATPRGNSSAAAIACVSTTGGWVANFAGSEEHVSLFLEIAATLKAKP